MNNLAKVLIGVGVVAAVATTSYVVIKRRKVKVKDISEQAVENDHKNDTIIDRIKLAAYKKAVKILAWATLNMQKIEAAAAILSLIGGIFTVVNAVRDFGFGKKMKADMDFMYQHDLEFEGVWNQHMTNQANRYDSLMKILQELSENMPKPKKKGA